MKDYRLSSWKKYPNELFYIAAMAALILQLLHLRYDLLLHFDKDLGLLSYSARAMVDALLLLLPYWLLPAKLRIYYVSIIVFLFSFWGLSQLWYYRTYDDLMPFSSFLLFDNISSLLLNSIKASMKLTDILFILPPFFLFILHIIMYAFFFQSFLLAISLLIGFPFRENFSSYSVMIFPAFISSW